MSVKDIHTPVTDFTSYALNCAAEVKYASHDFINISSIHSTVTYLCCGPCYQEGMSALHVACLAGHLEAAEALLEGGSALEAVDNVSKRQQQWRCVVACTVAILNV
jgi:hypothetical protein